MAKEIVKNSGGNNDQQDAAFHNTDNNPFKSEPTLQEETPEEAAEAEQKRKEALTERD